MATKYRSHIDEELDRPDMNKCPDCGCFFPQDNCPICGKECPEEMRAGKRPPIDRKEERKKNKSTEVVFVDWYHHWWFIILMLILFPIVGIILLATSPHKKSVKVIVISVTVAYLFLTSFGFSNIIQQFGDMFDRPVNTSMSKDEYIAACNSITPEQFYRNPDDYKDMFISMKLTVVDKFTENSGNYNGNYILYYICHDTLGNTFEILLRDCILEDAQNFIRGDVIVIYGEGDGNRTVFDEDYYSYTAPCVNVAYAKLYK